GIRDFHVTGVQTCALPIYAQGVIDLVASRHAKEGLQSPYLFPSKIDVWKPVTSIQRHWSRFSGVMRWINLPISHVVLRHRPRTRSEERRVGKGWRWRRRYE